MTYIADDIVVMPLLGRIDGIDAYREFMGPFVQILKRAELIAAFGDDENAMLMYDTETVPVPMAPGAECVTVENGKITRSHFIFDRLPVGLLVQAAVEVRLRGRPHRRNACLRGCAQMTPEVRRAGCGSSR
jgi:hypothetical protein